MAPLPSRAAAAGVLIRTRGSAPPRCICSLAIPSIPSICSISFTKQIKSSRQFQSQSQSHSHSHPLLFSPAIPVSQISASPSHRPITTTAATMSNHPDFKTVEASRPDWSTSSSFQYTKTVDPSWEYGSGANSLDKDAASKKHILIDPYEPGRPSTSNYKLLISGITPRPIGFVSTRSGSDPKPSDDETYNLAPFSYFNVVSNDPPLFALGVTISQARPKDTLRNLIANGECTVNIISDHFLEAANSTSMDVPPTCSEWTVSGLTPSHDVSSVSTPRALEAVFAVECRVESIREFESRVTPGRKSAALVILEVQRFWVREDALNADRSSVSQEVLRPMSRLGGISYGRTVEAVEIPRPVFERDLGVEGYEALEKKREEDKIKN